MNRQADTQFTHTQKYRQTKRDRDGCIERERQKVRKTNKKTGR